MLKISLLHAPDYMILTPKIEKSPYPGRGNIPSHTLPRSVASLPRAWSPRSLAFVLKIFSVFFLKSEIPPPPLPHTFEDLSTPLVRSVKG